MCSFIESLRYDGGKLYWREWKLGVRESLLAGTINKGGYRLLSLNGECCYAHRIVWQMHKGAIPEGMDIDHINHDRDDNAIENLRMVTRQSNLRNKGVVASNTGVMGVYWNKKTQRYTANITVNRKSIHLGTFLSLDSASDARVKAQKFYGFHDNHGKL